MVLIWTNCLSQDNKLKPYYQKRKFLQYSDALQETHTAIKDDYRISNIRDEEIVHQIVLLKYVEGKLFILYVAGTRDEINLIQKDKIVAQSLFGR